MKKYITWFKTYSVQIGVLLLGLVAAILGAQKLASNQGRKAAELDADIQKDVFDKAAAHDTLVVEVGKAKVAAEKASNSRIKVLEERNKLVADLKEGTKGKKKADILEYINRVE